jgi:hypothetical protein
LPGKIWRNSLSRIETASIRLKSFALPGLE